MLIMEKSILLARSQPKQTVIIKAISVELKPSGCIKLGIRASKVTSAVNDKDTPKLMFKYFGDFKRLKSNNGSFLQRNKYKLLINWSKSTLYKLRAQVNGNNSGGFPCVPRVSSYFQSRWILKTTITAIIIMLIWYHINIKTTRSFLVVDTDILHNLECTVLPHLALEYEGISDLSIASKQ